MIEPSDKLPQTWLYVVFYKIEYGVYSGELCRSPIISTESYESETFEASTQLEAILKADERAVSLTAKYAPARDQGRDDVKVSILKVLSINGKDKREISVEGVLRGALKENLEVTESFKLLKALLFGQGECLSVSRYGISRPPLEDLRKKLTST